jgi:hypothetical protein
MATPELYAFGKADADYLLSIIPGSGTDEVGPRRAPPFCILRAKTGGSGISAASSATCYYERPTSTSWEATTDEYTVFNHHPTASIAADTIILIAPINGRWSCIWEACP